MISSVLTTLHSKKEKKLFNKFSINPFKIYHSLNNFLNIFFVDYELIDNI